MGSSEERERKKEKEEVEIEKEKEEKKTSLPPSLSSSQLQNAYFAFHYGHT